jgi:hypothetical protein
VPRVSRILSSHGFAYLHLDFNGSMVKQIFRSFNHVESCSLIFDCGFSASHLLLSFPLFANLCLLIPYPLYLLFAAAATGNVICSFGSGECGCV